MLTDTIETKYGNITIPKNDHYIRNSLIHQKVWEKHLCDFFESSLTEGDIVIDAGSFVGTHALVMSKAVGDSGMVHAFEPGPFYILVNQNVIQNNRKNIIVHHKGLSDEESVMYIPTIKEEKYEIQKNWGAVVLEPIKSDNMDEVLVVTLDSLKLEGKIKLIKIDTEGMELKVLYGAEKLIIRDKPILVVEIHNPGSDHFKKVVSYLDETLGYKMISNFICDDVYGRYGTYDYLFLPKTY